jgi:NAD(P)-dependent dehydrogenase (short-subunit alcohol dehydrogenase family)
MSLLLDGKRAIVTGAASGIGEATARLFAAEGASVLLADIDTAKGEEIAETIRRTGAQACFQQTDVTDERAVEDMVACAEDKLGGLDVAFNSVGGPVAYAAADACESDIWEKAVALNMTSHFYCLKHQIPVMERRGGGAIVLCASRNADSAAPNMFAYTSTKHAIIGMVRSAALDLAKRNIRVNAILPGVTMSPMIRQAMQGTGFIASGKLQERIPMGRLAECREQAEAVAWLCSDRASYVTGTGLTVDGGLSAVM